MSSEAEAESGAGYIGARERNNDVINNCDGIIFQKGSWKKGRRNRRRENDVTSRKLLLAR